METAFSRYQEDRRLDVLRLQSAARNSTEWFEDVERYLHLDPVQLNYSLLTRSQRISHENLRMRDAEWLKSAEMWFQQQAGANGVLLDELTPEQLRCLVPRLRHCSTCGVVLEASGIQPEQLKAYAATGIDLISTSAPVTRSRWLDLSMRFT